MYTANPLVNFGIILLIISLISFLKNYFTYKKYSSASGKVTSVNYPVGANEDRYQKIIWVKFSYNSNDFTFYFTPASNTYVVGQSVPVLFDSDNPASAQLNNWFQLYKIDLLLCIFGVGLLLVS